MAWAEVCGGSMAWAALTALCNNWLKVPNTDSSITSHKLLQLK